MAPEETAGEDAQRRQIESEFLERLQDELSRLTVMDHLTQVLQTLPSLAFRHLGLTEESAAYRDLAQSRLAIDAFKVLVDVLARQLTPDEVSLYRSTLAQMQMAYVAQVDRGQTEAGAPETAVGAGGDESVATAADDTAVGADDTGAGQTGTGASGAAAGADDTAADDTAVGADDTGAGQTGTGASGAAAGADDTDGDDAVAGAAGAGVDDEKTDEATSNREA